MRKQMEYIYDVWWVTKRTLWNRESGTSLWAGWTASLKHDPYHNLVCIIPREGT